MSTQVAKLEGLLARVQARAAEPRPVAQAMAAPAEELELDEPAPESLEMLDEIDDIDEIDDVEIDDLDAPESGQVAAGTLEDAMEAAEHQPPMTPPPESGEGIMSPQIPPQEGPTMEQLGETISLDEGAPQQFELDEPTLDEPALDRPALDEPEEEMEAELSQPAPRPDEPLRVPDNAREELERVRLGDSTPIEARVSARPVLSTNVVDLVSSSRDFTPKSFLELIDSSLALK